MKKLITSFLFMLQISFVFGQTNTTVFGKVVDSKTQKPLGSVICSFQNTIFTQLTNVDGKFNFNTPALGSQLLLLKSDGYKDQLLKIEIAEGNQIDLGLITLEEDLTQKQQNSLIIINESDLSDDNSGSEGSGSLLQASRDAFLQAAAYNFGAARFSVRGIDNEYSNVMINGIPMNRIADGRPQYSNWGGLNDATRNQEFTNGAAPSDYGFGGIAGTQEINTRASIYRSGTRISFLNTNTNYSFRTMATTASGMNKKGWAFVVSAGRRWAKEGFYEGSSYSANSFFISAEKRINDKHSINFTAIYAQNQRGKNSPNTAELIDLAGVRYNSYWGLQEGEKRNSKVKKIEEPLFMLAHYWKINSKTNWNTTLSYQMGQIGNSRIDYTFANNPDPTYYRKLPSFKTNEFLNGIYIGNTPGNIAAAEDLKQSFLANKQLDWAAMYRINTENLENGSRFVLYEDRSDEINAQFNTNLSSQLSDNILMSGGIHYLYSQTANFKNMLDLLGGSYFKDISTFGRGEQQQSNLNTMNRTVGVGEHYGYNYTINATKLDAYSQFKFVYRKVDFYLAQSFSRSGYQRNGLFKNGYYPNNSLGKSDAINFDSFGFKGGLTYKLSGRNFIDFNGIYMTKAPNTKDAFPNSRINNTITPAITNETIKGIDASYIVKSPNFKARFTAYFLETLNTTDVNFYYADAVSNGGDGAFVSEVASGLNKRNRGFELGLEYQLTATLKVTGVAAYGEYLLTSNPEVSLTDDASATATSYGKAKLAGLRQAGMPQQAYSIGLEYRDPKFWWIGANANYLADNYLDVSSIRRTSNFYTNEDNFIPTPIIIDPDLANRYLKQEKFDSFYLFNLVGGKSWKFKGNTLGIFATVNNVLDQIYKTGGFEQSRNATYRQEYEDHQSEGASVFAPKYFYGYGRTYMVNIYLIF